MRKHLFIGDNEYKIFNGASWLKIFYHDADIGSFSNVDEARSCNEAGKYSILEHARDIHHYWKDTYEFLLEYPELQGFNRWRQSVYPLDASNDNVGEFVNVSCSCTIYNWKGLQRFLSDCSLLEESIGSSLWYYAIGMKANCAENWLQYFPGPYDAKSKVYLWMRVPDIKGAIDISCNINNHHFSNSFIAFIIFYLS